MMNFIQNLNADEASQVLKDLLDSNPDLTKKAYEIAMKVAGDVGVDGIMNDVFFELDGLDMDELNSRSGSTRYGYVDPYDAIWEMFEEALVPFIDEMKKNQQRALLAAAKTYCIGIVKGLRKYEESSNSDIKDWLSDAPGEYVDTVVKEWKEGNPNDEDIAEVMGVVEGG
jgi:hypothetical protein